MQYFISFLRLQEEYGAISIIKNPFDINIRDKDMVIYRPATTKLYDYYKNNHEIILEPTFQLKDLSLYTQEQRIFILYNYYYLQLLHEAVQKKYLSYKWCYLDEISLHNSMTPQNFQQSQHVNPYLINWKNEPKTLAMDILQNGNYFPLAFRTLNNESYIHLGRHRYYSLMQNKELFKNKKFLFLDFSKFIFIWNKVPITQTYKLINPIVNEPLSCYQLSSNGTGLFKTYHNAAYLIWNYFRNFSDALSGDIKNVESFVKPNPVFNNEQAWESFITKPFHKIVELEEFEINE